MQILLSSVKVSERVRQDLGNLDSLMESLRLCGQLNPITVTRDMELVAGFRRYTAAKRLGWKMIDATVVDGVTPCMLLEIEMAENLYRKDFTTDELIAGLRRLEKLRRPNPAVRLWGGVKHVLSYLAFWRYFRRRGKPAPVDAVPGEPEVDLPDPPTAYTDTGVEE